MNPKQILQNTTFLVQLPYTAGPFTKRSDGICKRTVNRQNAKEQLKTIFTLKKRYVDAICKHS